MYRHSVFLVIVSVLLYAGISNARAQSKKEKWQSYTIATLMDDHADPGSNSDGLKFEYVVKKHTYTMLGGNNNITLVKGDKFRLQYDSLNPVDAKILFEEPVFLPSEKLDDAEGTLKEVHKTYCLYKYHVVMERTKIQYYYEGTVEKYHLKKGDKFEVRFLLGYPERSIINFDTPY